MPQDQIRDIGDRYHVHETLSSSGILTICTAGQLDTPETRDTAEIVELALITLPSNNQPTAVQDYLQQLERRQQIQSTRLRTIHAWGQCEEQLYIASAIPQGVSLQYLIDSENIEIMRAIELSQQIALGLTALHAQNIAGLDLRPSMISIHSTGQNERIQINDIGLRPLLQRLAQTTPVRISPPDRRAHIGAGELTSFDPRYAPPEYLQQEPVGPWSDVYQLGILLFTLASGRLPFVGKDAQETAALQERQPLPEIRRYKHDVPAILQDVLQDAMQKDPRDRFTNAAAFIQALATIQQTHDIQASGPIMSLGQQEQDKLADTILPQEDPHRVLERESTHIGGIPTKGKKEPDYRQLPINGVYAYLSVESKKGMTKTQRKESGQNRIPIVQKETVLGRHDPKRHTRPDITLSSFDPKMTISRRHALIRYSEQGFTVEDLGSSNKTRIGDRIIPPHAPTHLRHGDILRLGSLYLRFEVPGIPDQDESR